MLPEGRNTLGVFCGVREKYARLKKKKPKKPPKNPAPTATHTRPPPRVQSRSLENSRRYSLRNLGAASAVTAGGVWGVMW